MQLTAGDIINVCAGGKSTDVCEIFCVTLDLRTLLELGLALLEHVLQIHVLERRGLLGGAAFALPLAVGALLQGQLLCAQEDLLPFDDA